MQKLPKPRSKTVEEQVVEVLAPHYGTIGECIDKLYQIREERLVLERKAEEMSTEETALRQYILANFNESSLEGAKGKTATASITKTIVPKVTDWAAVYDYIRDNDAFDLMERRMGRIAFRDRLESGEQIPGVEALEIINISLTKSRR